MEDVVVDMTRRTAWVVCEDRLCHILASPAGAKSTEGNRIVQQLNTMYVVLGLGVISKSICIQRQISGV